MSTLKPITIYGHMVAPNVSKTIVIIRELNLPVTILPWDLSRAKSPEFVKINPNGRFPAIHDPNRDITIWESGAIIEYLVSEYDKEKQVISFPRDSDEDHFARQYLHFQMSGQGPYYGQAFWFQNYHAEKLPSAIERYVNETKRVTAVLDKVLEGKEWLVGGKCSFADLAFLMYQVTVGKILGDEGYDASVESPNVAKWIERMKERPAVALTLKERNEAWKAVQLQKQQQELEKQ
ncbi:hypothetical protein AJ80_01476 [Polytolypa hystricis UAMH7299]|uniref:Glutathione S-transferase n=1 Tax=Polytolypa hystricis (strain UAMH7299) TaxID=1447883 RepID=A0A2B7YS86_POLH7|nr:hypothetical protein AJ80_01476 [Polytolypa hystricis UAMH7299]